MVQLAFITACYLSCEFYKIISYLFATKTQRHEVGYLPEVFLSALVPLWHFILRL